MDNRFMQMAIDLALKGMRKGEGGPFGAVIVKDGEIIGMGNNRVTGTNDPTAHAEVVAIRDACQFLSDFQLTHCTLYTTCEPCPMCLGAIYWARPDKVYYGCTRHDAAAIEFDDDFIYQEMNVPIHNRKIPMEPFMRTEALQLFGEWSTLSDKTLY